MKAAQAADLLTGLTDNGAGGLSSSVGEMAEQTNGATIHLERVPLKYPGLKPYEIVISESQERMTFSTRQFEALKALADHYDVEVADIGTFHDQGTFDILDHGQPVASLPLDFLHHGLPQMQLKAGWERQKSQTISGPPPVNPTDTLLRLLARPNICSREVLIRQYDHEVQGRSVIKPLMGPAQTSPCDAAVLLPELSGQAGLVVSNGLCPGLSDWDPYKMAACAMDEAVRNAVAVGADPASLTLLDNFCWPDPLPSPRNPDAEHKLGQLVRACQALHDLALVYRMPFISGQRQYEKRLRRRHLAPVDSAHVVGVGHGQDPRH
jgi:phosphoribosylformylglycinamidine (FGAM) synthase-like enzyme